MLKVKSNIDSFIKNYRKKVDNFISFLNGLSSKLANKMVEFMKEEIFRTKETWYEYGSYLNLLDNVDFAINKIGENAVRINIGDKLPMFEMSDGTLVNPAFFIEFGFGIIGQNNPKKNHEAFGWEYNINGHQKGWVYVGRDEHFHSTRGREGVNFMYNAQTKAKEFILQIINEEANGGI